MILLLSKKKIVKLKRKLESMRAGVANVKHDDLENFAKSMGRVRIKIGDEPTYVSTLLPKKNPISIPGHKKLNKFTVGKILDLLEEDLFLLEEISEN